MKTIFFTLISILFFFSSELQAQKTKNKIKYHKVWVSKVDNSNQIKGILYEVNSKSLKILDNHSNEIIIEVNDIETIKIRRKGKIGNGAAIGALTGIGTGALIGFMSGDDPDKTVDGGWFFGTYTVHGTSSGTKAAILGFSLGAVGSVAGAIIASKKDFFSINGDIKKYEAQVEKLRIYSANSIK